jgi:ABC-type bacteriocin/lantibiotic exporter with double-glycine peptidase domain
LFADYKGLITYNNYSLRDLDRTHLRDLIGKNVSSEDIFEGTILENILVGKPLVTEEDAIKSIQLVGLEDEINKLHEGLNTPVTSGGKGFSETFIQKLILARCLAKAPKLLILNDFFNNFPKNERLKLIQLVTDDKAPWTLLVVSNDPLVMAACERVLYMENGQIVVDGPFEEVIKNQEVIKNIY